MEPTNTLYSSLLLLGAAHGLFLALALINVKSGNTTALRLLALLTLTFAADLGVDFLNESRNLIHYPKLVFIESVTSFLYGPLTYLYVVSLTASSGFRFSIAKWGHFLPFVASILLLIPFFNLSDEYLLELIYSDAELDDRLGLWAIGGLLVELLPIPLIGVYLTFAVRRLIRHGRAIREQFSSIERISLVWLRNLLIALGLLYVLYLGAVLLSTGGGDNDHLEQIVNLATVIVIYSIGYLGLRQPVIFTQGNKAPAESAEAVQPVAETVVEPGKPKYERSALDVESSRLLLTELQNYMAKEEPYLDNKLTLAQLAERLGISSNYLSQVINEQEGRNFFDYINQHRVEKAKEILADPAQSDTTILTIAFESGFNSKSAFYTAFRQHANMTPSQYRASITANS